MQLFKPSSEQPPKIQESPSFIGDIQPSENMILEFSNQVPKLDIHSIPSNYPSILQEIIVLNLKPLSITSRIHEDFILLMNLLKNYKDLNSQEFVNLNYILIFYLEFKKLDIIADKLKDLIEKLEVLWGSPGLKITKSPIFDPTRKNRRKSMRVDYLSKVDNYNESFTIIKRVIVFFSGNRDFSEGFKQKTLGRMIYDITIFNSKAPEKNQFVEIIMEKNLQFFDQVLGHCRNDAFLKYYDYKIARDHVIESFYSFISRKHLISNINFSEETMELELNARIIEFCFAKKLRNLISLITTSKENVLLIPHILVLSFTSGIYEHLKKHLKDHRLLKGLANYNVMIEIFKLGNYPHTFLDFLLFVYSVKNIEFSLEVQKFIYQEFKSFLCNTKKISQIIYHMNPLMIFVAISQFFYRLSMTCDNFHYAFVNFAKILMNKCKEFIDNYADFDHLQTLVSNVYSPLEKSVLDMIFEDTDFFFTFFEEKRLSTIVRHNLDNSILYDFKFMEMSSVYKTLVENVDMTYFSSDPKNTNSTLEFELKSADDINNVQQIVYEKTNESLNIFKFIPNISDMNEIYKETEKANHFFQRKVFFSAISLRLIMDFLFFFGLFIYILIFTQNYTYTNYFFQQIDINFLNLVSMDPLTDPTMEAALQEGLNSAYNETVYNELLASYDNSTWTCIQQLYQISHSAYIVENILDDCTSFYTLINQYLTMNNKLRILFIIIIIISGDLFIRKGYQIIVLKLQFMTTLDIFEILNIIVCFVILILYRSMARYDLTKMDRNFKNNIIDFKVLLIVMSVFFALFLFLYWMKVTQYVKFWKKFGFIIKTIELMVRETTIFMVVYFINIAAFTSVLYVIYSNNSNFTTFFDGLQNLFGFSLGQFEFEDDESPLFDVVVSVILIIFLVISNIVMLNLLIAILSNVFNKLLSRIDLEISYNYFLLHKEYLFDEKYGHLTFFPRTFNVFLLPAHILAMKLAKPWINLLLVDIYFTIYFFFDLMCLSFLQYSVDAFYMDDREFFHFVYE